MVIYVCDRCHKKYSNKSKYTAHINRKFPCKIMAIEGKKKTEKNSILVENYSGGDKMEYSKIIPKSQNFVCKFCKKSYKYKYNLNKHIKKCITINGLTHDLNEKKSKIKMDNFLDKVGMRVDEIYTKMDDFGMRLDGGGMRIDDGKTRLNKKSDISNKNTKNEINFRCEYCFKNFSRKDSLKRHLDNNRCKEKINKLFQCKKCNSFFKKKSYLEKHNKKYCKTNKKEIGEKKTKIKKEIMDEKDLEINKLKEEIDKLKRSQHITYNNINVISFNKQPDLSHLTKNDYIRIINKGFHSVPKLIEAIHFNIQKPENHNVYIPNIKNNYMMIWNGKNWNLVNKCDIIDDMYEDNSNILIDKLEELKNIGVRLKPKALDKFKRFIERKEEDDIKNKIKEEIKLLLYNSKKFIKF